MQDQSIQSGYFGPFRWAVYYDSDPQNPLDRQEGFGTLLCHTRRERWHNDEGKGFTNMDEAVLYARENRASVVITANADGSGASRIPWWELDQEDLPSTLYFCFKEDIAKEGWTRSKGKTAAQWAEKYMLGVLKEMRQFFDGENYYYTVTRKGEHVDSCSGFTGDLEHVVGEAKSVAEYHNKAHKSGKEFARRFMCC